MKTPNIETMTKHYLIAAIWADAPEGTYPRASKKAKQTALETCTKFAELITLELFAQILEHPDYWSHPDCDDEPEGAIGHDLYLTSAGHGVGFWDRNTLPKEVGEKLSALCGWRKQIPEPEPYFYRGWMHL